MLTRLASKPAPLLDAAARRAATGSATRRARSAACPSTSAAGALRLTCGETASPEPWPAVLLQQSWRLLAARPSPSGFLPCLGRMKEVNRQVYLGGFDKEEEAAEAYDIAAVCAHGAAATLNFGAARYERLLRCVAGRTMEQVVAAIRCVWGGAWPLAGAATACKPGQCRCRPGCCPLDSSRPAGARARPASEEPSAVERSAEPAPTCRRLSPLICLCVCAASSSIWIKSHACEISAPGALRGRVRASLSPAGRVSRGRRVR